jgi:hypothetical protein
MHFSLFISCYDVLSFQLNTHIVNFWGRTWVPVGKRHLHGDLQPFPSAFAFPPNFLSSLSFFHLSIVFIYFGGFIRLPSRRYAVPPLFSLTGLSML